VTTQRKKSGGKLEPFFWQFFLEVSVFMTLTVPCLVLYLVVIEKVSTLPIVPTFVAFEAVAPAHYYIPA
jgi:hypothetical protein